MHFVVCLGKQLQLLQYYAHIAIKPYYSHKPISLPQSIVPFGQEQFSLRHASPGCESS